MVRKIFLCEGDVVFAALLNHLFPPRSLSGKEGEWITDEERKMLAKYPLIFDEPTLRAMEVHFLDRVIAGSTYDDCPLLKRAIHLFKYRGIRSMGSELGTILLRAAKFIAMPEPVLCSVPLHWSRKFSRGFNQADILSMVVAKEYGWSVAKLLKRVRPTGHQARRGRAERLKAMQSAFRFAGPSVPLHVILVDDVFTTGATLDECAKVLKQAGVKRVEAVTVACG